MATTRPQPTTVARPHQAVAQGNGARNLNRSALHNGSGIGANKSAAYGLPCAICHLYYPADLDACPTCQSQERVAPVVRNVVGQASQTGTDSLAAGKDLEQEREQLLREIKSQLPSALADVTDSPGYTCSLEHNHPAGSQPAEVCKPCHDRLQGRLDVCEAALHMDLKEAAQIIYDAVWADPSDPSKTYRNAASALLAELRKRAGINAVRGPFHPMAH